MTWQQNPFTPACDTAGSFGDFIYQYYPVTVKSGPEMARQESAK
ncbi:hypothetical protein GTPT_1847 [Tatumella ptyseos ATCC 33301]|uniref:Uncharacterized protein n=1 Tax=Tatumella ptyseos ATCC 33301 TaxID=1005995 RepID=A0A085JGB2_9GAMM|nr:hypothetical protein GTPT_1847 [Tatumella ptyseos ATCC 33301]